MSRPIKACHPARYFRAAIAPDANYYTKVNNTTELATRKAIMPTNTVGH
ncbi:MAG: hypothetical protein AB1589_18500 [Cyanobacteriota bacterium]